MNRFRLHHVYAYCLLLVAMGMAIHTPLTVWMSANHPELVEIVKAWKELVMLVAAIISCIEITRLGKWRYFLNDTLLRLMVAYVLLHLAMVIVFPLILRQEVAGLMIDLRFIAYFMLMYTLLSLYPRYKKSIVLVVGVGAGIILGFAVLQCVLPPDILKYIGYGPNTIMPYLTIDQNEAFVRINSTLRGPNPLGIYAVMSLLISMAYILKEKRSRTRLSMGIAMVIGSIFALWHSYSRSAWIAAVIGVFMTLVIYRKRVPQKILRFVSGWAAFVGTLFLVFGGSLVSNLLFHENPVDSNTINSNQGHIESIVNGVGRGMNQPIGAGVGSTGSASLLSEKPLILENYYLFVAHEAGWIGLILFVIIYGVILRKLWQHRDDWMAFSLWASGCGIAIAALFLPVWTDDAVSILWWGLAAIVLAKGGDNDKPTKQKAKRIA